MCLKAHEEESLAKPTAKKRAAKNSAALFSFESVRNLRKRHQYPVTNAVFLSNSLTSVLSYFCAVLRRHIAITANNAIDHAPMLPPSGAGSIRRIMVFADLLPLLSVTVTVKSY